LGRSLSRLATSRKGDEEELGRDMTTT
jgi:hypothetical protein